MAKDVTPEELRATAAARISKKQTAPTVTSNFVNQYLGPTDEARLKSLQVRGIVASTVRQPVIDSLSGGTYTSNSTTVPTREWTYDHRLPEIRVDSVMAAEVINYGNANGLNISSTLRRFIQAGIDHYKETT